MRFALKHETVYRYTAPVHYSIQQLRLTPRPEPNQRAPAWNIAAPGRLQRCVDAYGNIAHTMVLTAPHDEIRLAVSGMLEIEPLREGRLPAGGGVPGTDLSPLVFTVATPLTVATDSVQAFAADGLKGTARGSDFLALAETICQAVQYEGGVTEVTSTAAQALEAGRGVCQDHAHLFLACCRVRRVPARYVSGYVHPGDTAHAASHAWVDVWLDGEGWVSIDVTNREYASERHCRLALGRDYLSAAPVRGVRSGGGEESMQVRVSVRTEQ